MDGATVNTVELTVNMKTVRSDQSQRDGQFNSRIMETSRYPTATFKLTQPLVLATVPSDSTVVNVKATGDLTLHGVTKSVTFDLAAQRDGANIKVNGKIPVVFADYRIANPSGGPATTADNGVIEFLVVFEKV
jgi:polyisoprenoid-binding protein YceI